MGRINDKYTLQYLRRLIEISKTIKRNGTLRYFIVALTIISTSVCFAVSPFKISETSYDNRNPVLSFKVDNQNGFVAWDGLVNGKRRILFRELTENNWSLPQIIDDDPAGHNQYPSIIADEQGNVFIAWIAQVNGRKSPKLAARFHGEWNLYSIPFPPESNVKGHCDYVNVKLDENGLPWITWQWGFGNIYSVAVSSFGFDGNIYTSELTPKSRTHNLFPKVFFLPQPTVLWYSSINSDFSLVAKQRAADNYWIDIKINALEKLPHQSLPNLFPGDKSINAVWYDNKLENQDQIFYMATVGSGVEPIEGIIPGSGQGNRFVSGSQSQHKIATIWISERSSTVNLGVLDLSSHKVQIIKISGNESLEPGNPQLDFNESGIGAVWESDISTASKNSSIYFSFTSIK